MMVDLLVFLMVVSWGATGDVERPAAGEGVVVAPGEDDRPIGAGGQAFPDAPTTPSVEPIFRPPRLVT